MSIEWPWPLVLGGPLLVIIWIVLLVQDAGAVRRALGPLYVSVSPFVRTLLFRRALLLCIGLLILTILTNPYYVRKGVVSLGQDMNVMISQDVSQSMRAKVGETDRMSRSQSIAKDIVLRFASANVAVCEFTSIALCRAPFGSSGETILRTIKNETIESVTGSGSDITGMLNQLSTQFPRNNEKGNVLFLLSDGGDPIDNEYYQRDLDAVLAHLRDEGIVVVAIGVGESRPVPVALIPIGSREYYRGEYETTTIGNQNYEVVSSKLEEEKMKHIAEKTGGIYIHEDEFREDGVELTLISRLRETGIVRPVTQSLAWAFGIPALVLCWVYLFFFKPSYK